MNTSGLLLLAVLLPMSSHACTLDDIDFFSADDAVYYAFTQTKTVAALSRPLESAGVMALSASGALIWQTLRPLKSTLVVGNGQIRQYERNDTLVSAMRNPAVVTMAQIFADLLSGNTVAMAEAFEHTLICEESAWHLDLVPVAHELSAMLALVTLTGADSIETLSFRETRGDLTEIRLSAPRREPVQRFDIYLEE